MYQIALVNAPFASLRLPSLALTQLKHVTDAAFGSDVSTEILYLNHDLARVIGPDLYQHIAVDMEAPYNGFGDWFFRQAAFPELPDNSDTYFQRYFPRRSDENARMRRVIQEHRDGLDPWLDEVIDRHGLDERDVVGFTSMFSQNVACFALASRLKERNPLALILMGGANCETPMGEEIVRNVAAVDYVFSGCSLKTFPQFVRTCIEGDPPAREEIRGVFSRSNCATMLSRGVGTVGEELPIDTFIPLDYEPFLDSLARSFPDARVDPILLFETSRGCWWGQRAHCTFCGLNGMSMAYRAMSAENARMLIGSLFRYAPGVSRLQCVDNIMPKHYPKEVFAHLQTPPPMKIFYEVKAEMGEDDLQLLSDARVREVQPGIEALNTSTLKLMKKGTTVFQNLRFLANCVVRDIFPCWSLLVGFPGEGAEVYRKYVADIPRLVHLPPPSGVYPVRPDRYSPYQVRAGEFGLDLRPADFYELVYPFPNASIERMAYFFRDANFSAEYFVAMVEWFDAMRDTVEMWKARWNRDAHGLPPMLYLEDDHGTAVVHDSRGAVAVTHAVSPLAREILRSLARQQKTADLSLRFGDQANFQQDFEALSAAGFLFEEGDHILSIVFPAKPAWSESPDGWSWAA